MKISRLAINVQFAKNGGRLPEFYLVLSPFIVVAYVHGRNKIVKNRSLRLVTHRTKIVKNSGFPENKSRFVG